MKILLWPFRILLRLIEFIFCLTGRLIAAVIGGTLMIAGFVLTFTVIGAVIGIPLIVIGVSLFLRALF